MYQLDYTNRFKRSLKLCQRRGYDLTKLYEAIKILARDGRLPERFRPHLLQGNRRGQWECHIQPDWLLVWEQYDDRLLLVMLDTGTHADLFG